MRALKKLSRSIASALFSVALGETFDWVQSVPAGERPRNSPVARVTDQTAPPDTNGWGQADGLKPSAG